MSDSGPPWGQADGNVAGFDLKCLYDDMENPSEITVFTPEGAATATEWITIDRTQAVPLSQIR